MFQTKVAEEIKTQIYVLKLLLRKSCHFLRLYGKSIVERGRPQKTIWRMLIACWIPRTTNTDSGFLMLICSSTATVEARRRLSVTS